MSNGQNGQNGQNWSWENVNTEFSQVSVLGPLLVLIYINDLSKGVSSNLSFCRRYISFLEWLTTSSKAQLPNTTA